MSRRTSVGIELGQRLLKAAWLAAPGDQPGRLCLERGESDDAQAFTRMRAALAMRGIRHATVGLVAPNEHVKSTVVEVPSKGSQAPREVIAGSEFYRQLGLELESCELRLVELTTPTRRNSSDTVLVSGIERTRCESLCRAGMDAGLDVVYLGTPSDALLASGVVPEGQQVVPIVDAGWENTRVVLSVNGEVSLRRVGAGLGLKDVLGPLAEQHGIGIECVESLLMDPERSSVFEKACAGPINRWAALVAEDVRATLSYAHHRYPSIEFASCICVGGGFSIGAMRRAFESASTFPSKIAQPTLLGWETIGSARLLAAKDVRRGAA